MKSKQIDNIRNDVYEKSFQMDSKECKVIIEDAAYGEWDGKTEALDIDIVNSMCKGIVVLLSKHISKYNPFPTQIRISHQELDCVEEEAVNSPLITSIEPRFSLEKVALPKSTREQIEITLSSIRNREQLCNEWGLSEYCQNNRAVILNFYGLAGTGKSMTAEAIAGYLARRVLLVNYSELESKYVGDTPKNIKQVFENASKENAVLIFDEADSFLSKRLTSITQSADYGVNIARSVLLMELEHFDGIVVFTTNLIQNYDSAFKRRILANIEFALPDEEARLQIWELHIGGKLPLAEMTSAKVLAKQYDNISGADIKDMVFYAAVYALDKGKSQVELEDFDKAYQYIIKRYEN